jgi:hypothetical protein
MSNRGPFSFHGTFPRSAFQTSSSMRSGWSAAKSTSRHRMAHTVGAGVWASVTGSYSFSQVWGTTTAAPEGA